MIPARRQGRPPRARFKTLPAISQLASSFAGARQGLASCPKVPFGVSNGARVLAMAAVKKATVKASTGKKSWLPGVKAGGSLVDPEWLDGSLPGDFGFDPLGLGKDPTFLKWYREAEIKVTGSACHPESGYPTDIPSYWR